MSTIIKCILPGCEWRLDVTPPTPDPRGVSIALVLGASPGFFAGQAALEHAQAVEHAIEAHLDVDHTQAEMLTALRDSQQRWAPLMDRITSQRDEIEWLRAILKVNDIHVQQYLGLDANDVEEGKTR